MLALLTLVAAPVDAAPKAPTKAAVLALLRGAKVEVSPPISHVLADGDSNRFAVLFLTKGRDCYTREQVPGKPKECSPTTLPNAAVVTRNADGTLALAGVVALPTREAPWDVSGGMKWGIAQVRNLVRDGSRDLLVSYGYDGPSYPAVGFTSYRDLALVSLARVKVTLHLPLDTRPQAGSLDRQTASFKFSSDKPELVVTRLVSVAEEDFRKRRETTELVTWRYAPDAGEWRVVDTKRGKTRVVEEK
jgi:hypothetical protein